MALTKVSFDFPNGITADGETVSPEGIQLSGGEDFKVYKNEVVFSQKINFGDKSVKGSKITCKANYQCCNSDICMPETQAVIKIDAPQ